MIKKFKKILNKNTDNLLEYLKKQNNKYKFYFV